MSALITPPSLARVTRSGRQTIGRSPRCVAGRLVADYLRDWGLRDPELLAAESRRLIELTESDFDSADLDRPNESLCQRFCQAAIDRTITQVASWTASIAMEPPCQATDAQAASRIVARLPDMLDEFPEAVVRQEGFPARAASLLKRSVQPVVPTPIVRPMALAPRTRTVRFLRPLYWRQTLRLARGYSVRLLPRRSVTPVVATSDQR